LVGPVDYKLSMKGLSGRRGEGDPPNENPEQESVSMGVRGAAVGGAMVMNLPPSMN
jgi:hypothetical protein